MKLARKKVIPSFTIGALITSPLLVFVVSCQKKPNQFMIATPLTVNQDARQKFNITSNISNIENFDTIQSLVNQQKISGLVSDIFHIVELARNGQLAKLNFGKIFGNEIIKFDELTPEQTRDQLRQLYTKDTWQLLERYNLWVNQDSTKESINLWEYVAPFSMSSQVVAFDFKLMDNFDKYDSKVRGMSNKTWSPAEMKTLRSGSAEQIREMFKVLSFAIEREQDIDQDGVVNWMDDDIDGDGIPNEFDTDSNNDGQLNIYDDIDFDGIPNQYDNDIDGDGLLNWDDDDMDGDGILNQHDVDADGDGILDYNNATGIHDSTFIWSGKEIMPSVKLTYARILTVLKHRGYENLVIGSHFRQNMYVGSEYERPDFEIKIDGNVIPQPENDNWKPLGTILGVDTESLIQNATTQIEGFKQLLNYFTSNSENTYTIESENAERVGMIIDNEYNYDVSMMSSTQAAASLNGRKLSHSAINDSIRYIEPDNPFYRLQSFAIPKYMENTSEIERIYSIARENIFDGYTRINTNVFTSNGGKVISPAYAANIDSNLFTPTSSMIYGAILNNKSTAFMQYSDLTWNLMKLGSTWGNDYLEGSLVKVNNRNLLMPISDQTAYKAIYRKYLDVINFK